MRIDLYLFKNGFAPSRTRALNLIKLGGVKVDGKVITKPSVEVDENSTIVVDDLIKYASLGGLKLVEAVRKFGISDFGVCVDLGASNGGFTDCLLSLGAKRVYAVDVGVCALPQRLIDDERVVVMDKTNAKNVPLDDESVDFVTADLSFISITKILPEISRLLKKDGRAVILIKPQFEVGQKNLTKTGIVKSEKISLKAVDEVLNFARSSGLSSLGVTPTPDLFENKNTEYLAYLQK